jgi:hypothetical protein
MIVAQTLDCRNRESSLARNRSRGESRPELSGAIEILFCNALNRCCPIYRMVEKEYKEKVKTEDDGQKVEREFKDEFGNKVKEKHEVKLD